MARPLAKPPTGSVPRARLAPLTAKQGDRLIELLEEICALLKRLGVRL